MLAKTHRKLEGVSSTIDMARTRGNVMARKLKSAEGLSEWRTQALLPGADSEVVNDANA